MKNNTAFSHSLAAFAHPLSVGALLVLFLNDHLLRTTYPSWWTGKLGDLAWLVLAAPAVALLFALVVPEGWRNKPRRVFLSAVLLTGIGFTLAKTTTPVHQLAVSVLQSLVAGPVGLRKDPGDLITLIALPPACWVWMRVPRLAPPAGLRGWIVLSLAALLTLANSGMPNYGIICLEAQSGTLYAKSNYEEHISTDGGLSWEPTARMAGCDLDEPESIFTNPVDENIRFRYTPGEAIERSIDGGQTWQMVQALQPAPQAARAYYEKTFPFPLWMQSGPLDTAFDPVTGNTVFAMGHEGVLVYTAAGEWVWAPVGRFQRLDTGNLLSLRAVYTLLSGEIMLALGLALLSFSTLFTRVQSSRMKWLLLGLGWVVWLLAALAGRPALLNGYDAAIAYLLILFAGLISVPLAIYTLVVGLREKRDWILNLAGLSLLAGVLYLVPYLLWILNVLPNYNLAIFFGLLLAAGPLVLGWRALLPARQMQPR